MSWEFGKPRLHDHKQVPLQQHPQQRLVDLSNLAQKGKNQKPAATTHWITFEDRCYTAEFKSKKCQESGQKNSTGAASDELEELMCEQPTIFWCSCPCKAAHVTSLWLLQKIQDNPRRNNQETLEKNNQSQSLMSWGDGGVQDIDVNREINWCSCMRTERTSSQMTKYYKAGTRGTPAGPITSFHNHFPSKNRKRSRSPVMSPPDFSQRLRTTSTQAGTPLSWTSCHQKAGLLSSKSKSHSIDSHVYILDPIKSCIYFSSP